MILLNGVFIFIVCNKKKIFLPLSERKQYETFFFRNVYNRDEIKNQ